MKEEKSVYLLLTLTVRPCSAEEVEQTKDLLISGLENFAQIDPVRYSLHFRFCFLEYAYRPSLPLDVQYHPHLHCILAVKEGYFKGKDYIKHDDLIRYWRQACGLDYDAFVEARKLSGFVVQAYKW